MEPPVPSGPDNVVSAANLSCTVANEDAKHIFKQGHLSK